LIAFGPPFLIGLFYLIRDDISLGQLREMIASETAERQVDKETGRQGDGQKRSFFSPCLLVSLSPFLYAVLKVTGGGIL